MMPRNKEQDSTRIRKQVFKPAPLPAPLRALKAVYTIPELAELVGISRFAVARLIKSGKVQTLRAGRTTYVTLVALEVAFPEVVDSIKECQAYYSEE